MEVRTFIGVHKIQKINIEYYTKTGNIAIDLIENNDLFATLTVNLGEKLNNDEAYIDVKRNPWAEKFIKENKLGKNTGKLGFSGYNVYPLYKLNMKELKKYT